MLSLGIVGLPNAGKSTLFNALTGASVLTAPYPFSTKNPNTGIFFLDDPYIHHLANHFRSRYVFPPSVTLIDIAGLIKGAHKGEGLGNLFLSHISAVDAIIYVLDAYQTTSNTDITNSLKILLYELAMHDLSIIEKHKKTLKNLSITRNKTALEEYHFFEKYHNFLLNENFMKGPYQYDDLSEKRIIKKWQFLTAKPAIILLNTGDDHAPHIKEILSYAFKEIPVLHCNALLLEEIREMPLSEKTDILKDTTFPDFFTTLSTTIKNVSNTITFYTCNQNESRGYLIPANTPVIEAASIIHSDFARKFVKAEVISAPLFLQGNKPQIYGKDYIVRDYDLIYIRI